MKIKRAHRTDWQRVTQHRFAMQHFTGPEFKGYVSAFWIDAVREPLHIEFPEGRICLADSGYLWMQYFPQDSQHTLTTVFDAQGEVARFYIDICRRHYLDEQGVLLYEDLYLDLDVSSVGVARLLDVDELDEALWQEKISALDYELAWREADRLITALEADRYPLLWSYEAYRAALAKVAGSV